MEILSAMTSKAKFLEQILAIDFGNSRAKFLYRNMYKSFRYSSDIENEFKKFFFQKIKTPLQVLFSSVNIEQSKAIIEFLASQPNVYVYNIRDLINKQKKVNIFNYHWIGTDRILGLIGALEEFAPPIVTIDIGTAITINCVDEQQNFIGGLILPGPETQLKSLQENTSLLKQTKFANVKSLGILEVSTENAISAGIINSIWGGITYIVNEILCYYFPGREIPIVFTGGGFNYLKNKFRTWNYEKKYYRKNLVLSGIVTLASSEKQYLIDFNER
ncbi:MAG: type III pantothenate kinase [Ignavibacteria bacterium]|nr:type III pantothenate kinase [Ignavibacteria bacterium]